MGQLVNGQWVTEDKAHGKDGSFRRADTVFRDEIIPDPKVAFPAQSGRYHLYVSYACPWAHRTLIFRKIKKLEDHISVDVVHPDMFEDGWTFDTGFDGATGDSLFDSRFLREIYMRADPGLSARVTVPILWDKETGKIVNNESAEIIRIFNSAFNDLTGNHDDYWPEAHRAEIEEVNARIYDTLNNGVYRCGFARSQSAYDKAAAELFDTLDWLEKRLSGQRYLVGDKVTEADWRLVPTLFRFDAVYHTHFKCNRARIVDYPSLWAYTRELFQWPGVAETLRLDHITRHYYASHRSINPFGIVPIGPQPDWHAPHNRG